MIDPNSSTWITLKTDLLEQLTRLRLRNDRNLDPIETATVRGQISEIKRLLAFPERQLKNRRTEE